eukprot:CAMPEP_0113483050 /NCGR_PEP_ID=MMETSP0014_2-20120614/23235_1 /TAXON_ID=2857 /ORGANISM="Nitzschia sp." /LENGTH=487 /DNA_ID=CAMNT_0000376587 /DNA_START=166 /DNA_END=1629 /DNA_ORIENTATION=+ /assembly_acc=CAM_ASM_000159
MKFSVAVQLLSATAIVGSTSAFQSVNRRVSVSRPIVGSLVQRNAVAADPIATLEEAFSKSPAEGSNKKHAEEEETFDMTGIAMSGLNGQALKWKDEDYPTALQLRSVIPKDCFEAETNKSLGYLSVSVAATAVCTALGFACLNILPPENLLTAPFWFLYSGVTGTVAMGLWVLAHECGHGAFSNNKTIQDTVGYVLHSLFLVPYYSWQRSHAVHHRYTNHMELGETHVPEFMDPSSSSEAQKTEGSLGRRAGFLNKLGSKLGMRAWGVFQSFLHLIIGWPAYLLIGATGGTDRGMTNHYWPDPLTTPKQPKMELFPGGWKEKVFKSDIGVAAFATGAIVWAVCNGLPQMMALYGGPLIVVNAWLVLYTWLQHTDVDVPHYSDENHSFVKGALHTIDRPYDKLDPWGAIDFLHHKIGTTHVAHHFDSTIPHYKAQAATDAIKEKYPDFYLYDPTPIPQAVWRIAKGCTAVEKRGEKWIWNNEGVVEQL